MLSMFTFYNFEMFVLFINELDFILDYLYTPFLNYIFYCEIISYVSNKTVQAMHAFNAIELCVNKTISTWAVAR